MNRWTLVTLRTVIATALVGSVFVQTVLGPLFWADLDGAPMPARLGLFVPLILLIVTMQVSAVCIWQLLTLVRRGSVFTNGAFRYVNVVIGATAVASFLTAMVAVVLGVARGPAPGVVGLVCGASLVIAGGALLVHVMKLLLRQAIARENEAKSLRAELDEVV